MNSRKVAVIAALSALSTATNYAMISLHNVKLMDLFTFIAGFCFGPVVGALIGIFSWSVYGPANPFGFSLPIWASTMFSESIYGLAGGLIRSKFDPHGFGDAGRQKLTLSIFFGSLAVLLTFVYDLVTNIVFGAMVYGNILYAVVVGFVPFGILHVLSNAFFFGIGCVPVINAVINVVGGDKLGVSK